MKGWGTGLRLGIGGKVPGVTEDLGVKSGGTMAVSILGRMLGRTW